MKMKRIRSRSGASLFLCVFLWIAGCKTPLHPIILSQHTTPQYELIYYSQYQRERVVKH